MPSGGARSRSGPPPDPNALRRNRKDDAQWTTLPSEGRVGPTPDFPAPNQTGREAELWESMWRKPQAILWERDGLYELVALFVRQLAEAEVEKASAENRKTVRMLFADLWLTPDAMLRNRIRIDAVAAEVVDMKPAQSTGARARLVALPDVAGD